MWGSGPNDVYVGYSRGDGPLQHFDGQTWEWVSLGSAWSVSDVWGSSETDVFVATEQGVKHFDGLSWSDAGVSGDVVVGTGPNDVYVLGREEISHFQGGSWETIRRFAIEEYGFYAGAMAFPGDQLVTVRRGLSYGLADSVLRWNGSGWTSSTPPGVIRDLWGVGSDDLFAVGYVEPNSGTIWNWNGSQWNTVALPHPVSSVTSIFGLSGNQMLATTCCDGVLLKFDGSWQSEVVPGSNGLYEVWASGPNDVYVISDSPLHHFNETGWSSVFAAKPKFAELVWAESPQRLVIVGWGEVYRYEHGSWTEELVYEVDGVRFGSSPTGITGKSWDDLYVSDDHGGIIHYDGDKWSFVINDFSVLDMSLAADGALFAVGYDGLARWYGGEWTKLEVGDEYYVAVWAANANYAVAIGGNAFWKYDGQTVTKLADYFNPWGDVWGVSEDEMYFSARNGLLAYNGTSFQSFGPPQSFFNTITGTSSDHIVAVGNTIFFKYGEQWHVSELERNLSYLHMVPALDGSIVRLTEEPDTEARTISFYRP